MWRASPASFLAQSHVLSPTLKAYGSHSKMGPFTTLRHRELAKLICVQRGGREPQMLGEGSRPPPAFVGFLFPLVGVAWEPDFIVITSNASWECSSKQFISP